MNAPPEPKPKSVTGDNDPVPVSDLRAQHLAIEAELHVALDRVFARSWFILGEELAAFEQEFAGFIGIPHAVGVASGTDAIHLALRALGITEGDHVLTAPNSAVPTAAAIMAAGATPCFADVDPQTGLLDPASVEEHLDHRVKAIVPVHLYGRCVPMDAILEIGRRRGVPVVEDAAQAHGATWRGRAAGTFGAIGCFSFYPSKNLGACGDAGACVTADPALAARLRRLRNYGERDRYLSVEFGINSRLDELQAAILRVKLPRLAGWNARRRELAAAYRQRLAALPLAFALPSDEGEEVVHLFVAQVARRDRLREILQGRGILTQIHYPRPIHLHPAYAHLGLGPGSFPVAERRAEQIVSLPLYPEMTSPQQERVIAAVAEALDDEEPPAQIRP
jgi:dTDP-4-amino-4,6-dideoxygalactose transaminase